MGKSSAVLAVAAIAGGIIAFLFGWSSGVASDAISCERLGGFYSGPHIYRCQQK